MTETSTAMETKGSPELVQSDVLCIGCKYNLRTLRVDGVCPECAIPVSETLRHHVPSALPTLLLIRLRWGLRLALVYWLITTALNWPARYLLQWLPDELIDPFITVYRVAFFVLPLLAWWCTLLLAGDTRVLGQNRIRTRTALIVLTHAILVYEMLSFFNYLDYLLPDRDAEGMARVLVLTGHHANYIVNHLLSAAQAFLLYSVFAIYAERFSSPGLSKQFHFLRWAQVAQILLPLVGFYSNYVIDFSRLDFAILEFGRTAVIVLYGVFMLALVVWAFVAQVRLYSMSGRLLRTRRAMPMGLRAVAPVQVRKIIWCLRKAPALVQYRGR